MSLRIRNWKDHFENAESRKLKRLSWVGVPNKMHGNGYNALVGHPNGAAHLGAWYAIVEVCSLREPRELRGNLPESDGTIGGISRALGRISRLPVELFAEVLPRLIHDPDIQWIEQYGDIPGENPETSGENPETPAANRRGLEGIGGEGKGKEPPKPPASGETLFDEQTSANSPSVVRPDVPPQDQNGSGAIAEAASRIHGRHPARRKCSLAEVRQRLKAILLKDHQKERAGHLARIDANHANWCRTYDWTKEDGEFAKGLDNWLAPTKGRFDEPPPAERIQESSKEIHYNLL